MTVTHTPPIYRALYGYYGAVLAFAFSLTLFMISSGSGLILSLESLSSASTLADLVVAKINVP